MENPLISQEGKLHFSYIGACLEFRNNQALIAKPPTSLSILHLKVLQKHLLTVICLNKVLEGIECWLMDTCCPPGPAGPSLQSSFPAGQPPACTGMPGVI